MCFLQVKEWLCLNCQMQRALGASEVIGPSIKPGIETNKGSKEESLNKETPDKKVGASVSELSQKKVSSTPGSPQRNMHEALKPASKEKEAKTQPSPSTGQSVPNMQSVTSTQKHIEGTRKSEPKHNEVKREAQKESEKTAGSTYPEKVTEASKTTESLGGKMFGFGSSIFSSASNLISSAVQEESRTTPPASRKMSAPPQISGKLSVSPKISPKTTPPVSPKMSPKREPNVLPQKSEQVTKPEESHQKKEEKSTSQPRVGVDPSRCSDGGVSTCPLCKGEMNIGSKHPPNYNTCTDCKTTVCNQCGFNPMPMGEVSTQRQTKPLL